MKKLIASIHIYLFFVAFLFFTYWVHVSFFKVDVILYSAIADGAIATLGAFALLLLGNRLAILSGFERAQLVVICFLSGYIFAISIPTVIDRSLSFYILEKIEQRGGGIQFSKFEDVFSKEYLKEHRLVDVRLTEQLQSGTIVIEGGCVKLTQFGEFLVSISLFFRSHFLPKRRLLMGQYSDDLTHPFAFDFVIPDYRC